MRREASLSSPVSNRWRRLEHAVLRHLFTDWKKKRRTFPVGSDLKTVREECKVLEARNIRKEDFDIKADSEPPERLTIAKYLSVFLQTKRGRSHMAFGRAAPVILNGY
jgi:hypothetical protein